MNNESVNEKERPTRSSSLWARVVEANGTPVAVCDDASCASRSIAIAGMLEERRSSLLS